MFRKFVLGISICLIAYIFLLPFYILYRLIILNCIACSFFSIIYILAGIAFIVLGIGIIFDNRRIPFISYLSEFVLSIGTNTFKDFLKQSSKYFCSDNATDPFSKVVLVNMNNNIQLLGLQANQISETIIMVYIPTAPSPQSGITFLVETTHVSYIDLSPEDLIKITITCGAFNSTILNNHLKKVNSN